MTVYVVRHAKAGSRRAWSGDDSRRPLSKPGRRQAELLVALLEAGELTRIVSSPYVRCVETVEPLAEQRNVSVEQDERLAEGEGPYGALALARELGATGGVLCSHGDVITELLARLERAGVPLGDAPRCEKGSVWALELTGEEFVGATYLPPPT